ncbi:hypothetical protein EYF80_064690 [Liparis tanakae]|uniref:Uncharacterized protein n=1 Tax=Liparis tanakae TaxID=230148 RepID=A0A4Z2EA90_9TELE|nr:hypothetical protein EYF80_064690 [Liparis tanakae]
MPRPTCTRCSPVRLHHPDSNAPPLFVLYLQPDELEALHSHTFRVKTFKKAKHCGVCKATIGPDGLVCRDVYISLYMLLGKSK